MQAVGGLIAAVIVLPISLYVVYSILTHQQASHAIAYAPPAMGGATTAPTVPTVAMQPAGSGTYVFSPNSLTVHVGQSVVWTDADTTMHNIIGVGSGASVINRPVPSVSSYTVKFTKAGTYKYECSIHLPQMVGTIKVI